jgi:hypothetical protein
MANYATPSGLDVVLAFQPRAALRLPWAAISNPFGVKTFQHFALLGQNWYYGIWHSGFSPAGGQG